MTKRVTINGVQYEASHPTPGPRGTVWFLAPIGKRGRPVSSGLLVGRESAGQWTTRRA